MEVSVPASSYTGVADDVHPPFEKRFVSDEVGHGLFTKHGAELPARFVLGEYSGVARSEAIFLTGEDMASDDYRAAYPAVDGGGSMYVTARLTGGWMRLVNHAPARQECSSPPPQEHLEDPSTWTANCAFEITYVAGIPRIVIATTRPVDGGRQLLVDYGREHCSKFLREWSRAS